MAPPEKLQKFEDAMQRVYSYVGQDPTKWIPPQNSGGHKGRYLWADAFGVVNFLTLYHEKKDTVYLLYAKSLIDAVHHVLGRTRDGTARLPGATDESPLGGGLRIGKEEEKGPDGDGQYHHYLTIWMFALNRMSKASGDQNYNHQATTLAQAVHPRFIVDRDSPQLHMVWKMSVDLDHSLVKSEGNLDPINGYVVFRLLQATAETETGEKALLEEEINDYERIMERKGQHHVSGDALDLGMSLFVVQLVPEDNWAKELTRDCINMLRELFDEDDCFEQDLELRLAFREFGTCLGIGCHPDMTEFAEQAELVLSQWDGHMTKTPKDIKAITWVMYASALIPGAFRAGYL